jgi:hypothetical protein
VPPGDRVVDLLDRSAPELGATAALSRWAGYQPEREPASDDGRRHIAHGSRLADRGDHLRSIQTNACWITIARAGHLVRPLMADAGLKPALLHCYGDAVANEFRSIAADQHPHHIEASAGHESRGFQVEVRRARTTMRRRERASDARDLSRANPIRVEIRVRVTVYVVSGLARWTFTVT